ncbi:MAG: metal ABC transporter solute-binding protein, Zn/Mn family [Burkholderiales bacterium]
MIKKVLLAIISYIFLVQFSVAAPIRIVAAENFYAELAREIGGSQVVVQSIINNPNSDPHLFATSPATSRSLANAQIIIYNGMNYDSWMNQLLNSLNRKPLIIINVADLIGSQPGVNPHIWYQPTTFPTLAKAIAAKLISLRPDAKAEVSKNLDQFLAANKLVLAKINAIKGRYANTPVTATEPVFGYMAEAMGLDMKGLDFQWKIMNDTEPSPKMLAEYQALLTKRQVKVLFYNNQVADLIAKNILELARINQINIVGVTETMPNNTSINDWLLNEINLTHNALKASH